jgi:hypothetical protein
MEKSETNQSHPITPPPELLDKWDNLPLSTKEIFVIAAQWGADRELEACCAELSKNVLNGTFYVGKESCPSWHHFAIKAVNKLRAARRPKPPNLKEQALKIMSKDEWSTEEESIIRRALELLPDDTTP